MRATIALGSVVRKPNSSCSPSTGALLGPLAPRQGVQRPAKAKSGLSSPKANQTGVLRGLVSAYSQKDVAGTTHRLALPSHRRQCGVFHVPIVRHRLSAELRRPGHAPTRHDELALAVGGGPDEWRHLVREDGRQRRQVAGAIALDREQIPDGRLVSGNAVKVAHELALWSAPHAKPRAAG